MTKQLPARRRSSLAARAAVLASAVALSGCRMGVLAPEGPVGGAERTILFDALAIMLAIVVPTIVATLAFAWWYRASNPRAVRHLDFVYSGRVELVVWSIPVLVIIFLGGIAWIGSHDLDPARAQDGGAKPLEVQVVSLDWKWLFLYPAQGVASVNQLVVPAATPVHFSLTSASVMNTFFVPQLGSMIYTMNGMTTQLNLKADREGVFEGLSGHFSGDGFPGMRFAVKAVSAGAFDDWVAGAKASGPGLDRAGYVALAKQSMNVPPSASPLADADLFPAIASQEIAPAPGPPVDGPAQAASPKSGG